MTVTCQMCGHTWAVEDLLDAEGLRHFHSPGQARQIVEQDGKVWEVTFGVDLSIHTLSRCGYCPHVFGPCSDE